VDYDVLYVTPAYGRPSGLNGDGSRNPSLRTNGDSLVRGLDALALSPDDLLIYSAQESASGGNALTSVYSLNEQFGTGTSRARWRFTIHGGYGIDPGQPRPFHHHAERHAAQDARPDRERYVARGPAGSAEQPGLPGQLAREQHRAAPVGTRRPRRC
jgi:hypothetical protein